MTNFGLCLNTGALNIPLAFVMFLSLQTRNNIQSLELSQCSIFICVLVLTTQQLRCSFLLVLTSFGCHFLFGLFFIILRWYFNCNQQLSVNYQFFEGVCFEYLNELGKLLGCCLNKKRQFKCLDGQVGAVYRTLSLGVMGWSSLGRKPALPRIVTSGSSLVGSGQFNRLMQSCLQSSFSDLQIEL